MRNTFLKSGLALGIGAILLFLSVLLRPGFHSLQLRLSNTLYKERTISDEIVIVALDGTLIESTSIDFKSDKKRTYFAETIEYIEGGSPSLIMLDWLFDGPANGVSSEEIYTAATQYPKAIDFTNQILAYLNEEHPYDALLSSVLEKWDNIYFIKFATHFSSFTGESFDYREQSDPTVLFGSFLKTGFANLNISSETNVQSVYGIPAYLSVNGTIEPHMDLQLAQEHLRQPLDIPLSEGEMLINYAGVTGSYPTVSIVDVLNGTVDPSVFSGKIVLIGPTASEFQDNKYTPIDPTRPMPGIEIHANAIQTILDEAFLTPQSGLDFALVLALILTVSCLIFMHSPLLWSACFLALELFAFPFYAQWRFDHGVIINLIWPVFALVAGYISILLYRNFTEFAERRRLKEAFGRYVSPELVEQIGNQPDMLKLGGERRAITALFLDIENFTHLSEGLEPQAVVGVINTYFDALSKVIMNVGGMVDKFEGDAIMALFGAPVPNLDHAVKACATALAIREKMNELNASTGYPLNIRIGLASGDAIVGNMGSENRFDYTAMGDTVNTASRLEGANKFYSTRILVTQGTYETAKGEFLFREVDAVCLKGKDKAIHIYELLGTLQGASEEGQKVLVEWDRALAAYRKGAWTEAEKGFKAVLSMLPNDGPSKTLLGRLDMLKNTALTGWDGVWRFESK
ncbi:adenylate/guanylate cyclase domain-containing protein [Candidatus Peregrinibacteria bacterium]|nr:MAG: adenylate/guanylate cyclase domain-containing protein [Candidatus Peregrinibacteria bacterium]